MGLRFTFPVFLPLLLLPLLIAFSPFQHQPDQTRPDQTNTTTEMTLTLPIPGLDHLEITQAELVLALASPLIALALYYLVPFITNPLRKYPGPTAAKLSRFWLAKQSRNGVRSVKVDEQHRKHGTFVQIGPNEVSIADPRALPIVYAHGSGSLKTDFYDAFVSIHRGLFNTRDRAEHTRKRKIVSHTFSPKSVREFEPYIAGTVRVLLQKWDALSKKAKEDPSGGKMKGYAVVDTLDWFNALAFDVIGDLAFGAPFGMLERDAADIVAITTESGDIIHAPAVRILNERGEFSATQGSIPPFWRPYTKYFDPWFARGQNSVKNLAGIARNKVNIRLQEGSGDRKDILSHLQAAKDSDGKPLPKPELTAEALTQLIAGSDTTSNSSCAILFFIVRNKRVHQKLVAELDETFGARGMDGVLEYEDVKGLPYLEACINEALRRHSTSGMGLPRLMVQDTEVLGEVFPAGTILSVPSYSIHHLESVWGPDAREYRPERWLEDAEKAKELEKALNIFSVGPRSCVGRNVAMMELFCFISTIIYRYDFKLVDEVREELDVAEGFLRKPLGCMMGLKRRETS
ncbi:cytochrome P450 [Meredithblackwellia eburnea MCA 4105]